MTSLLSALFFVSGAAALLFETLWFRQAGLAFGNSVWASTLVLASFMAGLALGSGLVMRNGARIHRPVRLYGWLELAIAASGILLVFLLPSLGTWLSPLLGRLEGQGWILNPLRLFIGFLILSVPSTAMGATLPLLVKALRAHDPNFGSVLGRLYGWNTLGAVFGALAGEFALFAPLGIRGSGFVACGMNVVAFVGALYLSGRLESSAPEPILETSSRRISTRARRLLVAAFLSGAVLLALEIVWFRFLLLFVFGSGQAFSLMLAVVLVAIALGGWSSGRWLKARPGAHRWASLLALLSGILVVGLYAAFARVIEPYGTAEVREAKDVLWLATTLILPVAWISGALFTLTGAALSEELEPETRAAGWVTMANTIGSGLGSLVAGFLLLPLLGIELSLFVLAGVYAAVAFFLLPPALPEAKARLWPRLAAAVVFVVALASFPFGSMQERFVTITASRYGYPERARIAAFREGRTENVLYLEHLLLDEPTSVRLVTNSFSMSGSGATARRYMKLFVYWPVALRPDPKKALLICYGVGSTAKALQDTASLEQIDVVDISDKIVESSSIVYPDPADDPLNDPRFRVHIDDGRYFLQSTSERYDLITGEPPPVRVAGVWSLYSKEYFQLVYDRLAEGGINTHWLPLAGLAPDEAQAIIRAYCEVFEDASLWVGFSSDWMLVGSRNAQWSADAQAFGRQWADPVVSPELRRLALERPEQLGATFVADAAQLLELCADVPPLVDDRPKRIHDEPPLPQDAIPIYASWMNAQVTRQRFAESAFIREVWPEGLRERTLAEFDYQRMLNEPRGRQLPVPNMLRDLHAIQAKSSLETLVLWKLGLKSDELEALDRLDERGAAKGALFELRAGRSLAQRDYVRAANLYGRAFQEEPGRVRFLFLHFYALGMAGRVGEANGTLATPGMELPMGAGEREAWAFLVATFGLEVPGL